LTGLTFLGKRVGRDEKWCAEWTGKPLPPGSAGVPPADFSVPLKCTSRMAAG